MNSFDRNDRIKKYLEWTIVATATVILCVPALRLIKPQAFDWMDYQFVFVLHALGWFALIALFITRARIEREVRRQAFDFGFYDLHKPIGSLLAQIIKVVQRKDRSLSVPVVERRITSRQELSRALEQIVALAYKLLEAESAELALFDTDSNTYHSSFVLGRPFREDAQTALAGSNLTGQKHNPEILIQPIAFAGSILGSLRVALPRGRQHEPSDQDIMRILALQSGLAILNAEYSKELVRMKEVSDESVKAKTGFLANLSHEIRGPLGLIINANELVLDDLCGPLNSDQRETLELVKKNGTHLLDLINDVLDYAKVESGKVQTKPEEIQINDTLSELRNVVRSQAELKKHVIEFKDGREILCTRCDRRHFRQMLINLLTNAIKYTPDGGKIELSAERVPGQKIKISVKDSGVGIEAKDRHKVFSAFERIENSYSLQQVGTGLGMPLTRRLAEVNGGTIDFESTPGAGTHFWLLLPAVEYNPAQALNAAQEVAEAVGQGESVLLVDSDESERGMMVRYLKHIGFKVIVANSKEEVLLLLEQNQIDCAIIDNAIVDQPDDETVRLLREKARSTCLPLILSTSRAFAFDIEKYLKAGIDLCLIKPVPLKELGTAVRELIDADATGVSLRRNAQQKTAKKPVAGQATISSKPGKSDILQ